MNKLKISLIAFPGATEEILKRGEQILKNKLQNVEFEIVSNSPDALFIITGGSENQAKNLITEKKRMLLLAITESNSYAAASEIKAFCNQNELDSILYNLDTETEIQQKVNNYIKCNQVLNKLTNYTIGLIGEVSEWLIASDIDKNDLKNKFGLELKRISWNEFPEYSKYSINNDFLNHFSNSKFDLEDSSKVYNLLEDIIKTKQLDAVTVECFPLVRENAVTACLALSNFNKNGLPAGCEGDITSISGKIILKELTGQIPWMANLAALEDDKVFFAHCTIATDLVSDYTIKTHFETNQGTAVQGQFKSENATVFRLNNDLSKAFLSFGRIVERPNREDSCRTQIKIEISTDDIQKLKDNPLGNHHLILPGNHVELLQYFCKLTGIEIV